MKPVVHQYGTNQLRQPFTERQRVIRNETLWQRCKDQPPPETETERGLANKLLRLLETLEPLTFVIAPEVPGTD